MKSDRALIGAVLCLAAGIALIITYCTGATSMNAAYPLASSSVHLELTATGAAALGGIALCVFGLLMLVWAFLCAIVGQIGRLAGLSHDDEIASITRGLGEDSGIDAAGPPETNG